MKKDYIIKGVAITALLIGLFSCANSHIKKGDKYYENLAYASAIDEYSKVYYKTPTHEVGIRLADSYYKTNQLEPAEVVYEKVVSLSQTPNIHYFNYAKVLMANNKHEKAKRILSDYIRTHEDDAVAKMLLASCYSINDRYRDTSLFELKEIEMNGYANTFSVSEYQNGIVFSADKIVYKGRKQNPWTGQSYLDLYHMKKDKDGTWLAPQLLQGDVNGRFHEGPATFSADGQTVYFTRSNYYKKKLEVNEDRVNNLKIFQASLIKGEWKNLQEMPFNSDDYSVGHPTLSKDGLTLYFISDMPGGKGGTDIYRSEFINGEYWSDPINLGSEINTAGNEMFPYIHEDGTLYFSSDAHNTMGGLDVFLTYFNGERWAKPENLNYPLNSIKDDFGYVLSEDNETGFVSSSRNDQDKIYEFKKFAPKFNLFGFAHEKGNRNPVEGVIVEITDVNSKKVLKAQSDKEGKFNIKLMPEKDYELYCTKMGCFSRTDRISTIGLKYSQDFYADFIVEPIIINKPIVLENIYYDFDKWDIRPDAAKELDKLVKLLKDNLEIDIEMGSHTDVRGSDQYNQVLSDRRAYAAVQYLIKNGIDAKRLTWKGYGESVLVNECANDVECTEEKHQENRRTEFKVTKINE